MRAREVTPAYIIDINEINNLGKIDYKGGFLRIGALATLYDVEKSTIVHKNYVALCETLRQMGTIQIRNMGTIIGNICRASPAADTPPTLLALSTAIEIASVKETRMVSLDDFFVGPGETILKTDEMVTGIRVSHVQPGSGCAFLKTSRTRMDLAKVNVAVRMEIENETCLDVRIALGGVAPTPLRVKGAETALRGGNFDNDSIREACEIAASEVRPITDVRSTKAYRTHMTKVIIKRAIGIAIDRGRASKE
jgi:carbon-monoxide dehydrogenase medium subunit